MNHGNYLDSVLRQFQYYKELADKTFALLSDDEIHWHSGPESNSVAVIVKHMAGNMLSRFTRFLTEDGEKPWRNRDTEFEDTYQSREEMLAHWESGWKSLFEALSPLTADNLQQIVYIRNEGHTVLEALNRQLAHYAYHIGQIVFLGKMLKGAQWTSLSIPKGQSDAYNQAKFDKEKGRRHFTDNP